MEPFQPYGVSHWVVLALLAAGLVPAVLLGRSTWGPTAGRVLAVLIPLYCLTTQVAKFVVDRYDWEAVLPLQLCDLAWMTAAWALWTHGRLPTALTYFWGLPLTSQAILTPALREPWPDVSFFAFWGQHLLIVWAAVFLVWGLRIRPDWQMFRWTVAVTAAWLVVVYGVNAALDTNYGYVNRKPPTASILDLFGPWPVYLLVEIVIIAVVWALMTWPWARSPARPAAQLT